MWWAAGRGFILKNISEVSLATDVMYLIRAWVARVCLENFISGEADHVCLHGHRSARNRNHKTASVSTVLCISMAVVSEGLVFSKVEFTGRIAMAVVLLF